MTRPRRKSLSERANDCSRIKEVRERKAALQTEQWQVGYGWGVYDGWLTGYRSAQRDARRKISTTAKGG